MIMSGLQPLQGRRIEQPRASGKGLVETGAYTVQRRLEPPPPQP
jgi:hypothetical protein